MSLLSSYYYIIFIPLFEHISLFGWNTSCSIPYFNLKNHDLNTGHKKSPVKKKKKKKRPVFSCFCYSDVRYSVPHSLLEPYNCHSLQWNHCLFHLVLLLQSATYYTQIFIKIMLLEYFRQSVEKFNIYRFRHKKTQGWLRNKQWYHCREWQLYGSSNEWGIK